MSKPVILLIDDEVIILESLRRQLFNALGSTFTIEIATDGEEGIAVIQELMAQDKNISIVITDYFMPGMPCIEILHKIKEISPTTKAIVLSGQADTDTIDQAKEQGTLFGFLAKPWIEKVLLRTIQNATPQYFS